MPRKASISRKTTAAALEEIQVDLGLVRTVKTKDGPRDLLTSVELGRRVGIPGKWGTKGSNTNLIAEAAGLIHKPNGRWAPTKGDAPHMRKVDGRWRWYPSAVHIIRATAKTFDWSLLKGSKRANHG